ncbi:asparagine synthase-related protein [Sulfurovum sp.]|uniref:asparagine synthase-related protein n=1 Tax=Sulfurovum sp. TaxID=1969726 RepID=UPI0035613461
MSGIFGVFSRNGEPVDRASVNAILDAVSTWDPDERNVWINETVALGHTMLWNTAESKYEHLPLHTKSCVLTMDARIDNRDELVKEFKWLDRPLERIGDSEFILEAYLKWGEDCPKYLLGDFSFAIWDDQKQQLFCARDHVGIKLFHYYISDKLFIFSNDIEGILEHTAVPKTLDDNTVATFLKDEGIHSKRATFFEKIKRLPAATTLTVTRQGVTEKKYWDIEKSPSIHFDTYEEYVERLKELLDSAVEARLRTVFPITSHLSGGIDSSPIAVLAARKLKKRNKRLYAFNWINVPKNDEYEYEAWNFSRRIAASENIIHKEFSIDPKFMVKQYEEHNFLTRGTMFYWREYVVQEMVENIGARTVLSGWGGDELISHSGSTYIADLWSKGKLLEAFKQLFYEKRHLKYSWSKFVKRGLSLSLSPYIINFLRHKKEDDENESEFYNRYTTEEFAKFMDGHQCKKFPVVTGVRKKQLVMFDFGHLQNRIESWALSAFPRKIEYVYPLLDKRVVEFAIGIPEEMFYPKEGVSRHFMKNAVADLLPSDITWFPKPDETKINQVLKQYFTTALEIMQKAYKNKDDKFNNKYLKYDKMKYALETFDFEKFDSFELQNIVVAILLINSMKKI